MFANEQLAQKEELGKTSRWNVDQPNVLVGILKIQDACSFHEKRKVWRFVLRGEV